MTDILRWAITLWLASLMAGVSAWAIHLALRTVPIEVPTAERTPAYYAERALRHLGVGLVWVTIALLVGGILGAGIVGALRAFGS